MNLMTLKNKLELLKIKVHAKWLGLKLWAHLMWMPMVITVVIGFYIFLRYLAFRAAHPAAPLWTFFFGA